MAGRPLRRLRMRQNPTLSIDQIMRAATRFGFVVDQKDESTLSFSEPLRLSADQLPGLRRLGTVKLIGPSRVAFSGFGVRSLCQFDLRDAPSPATTVATIVQLATKTGPALSWPAIAHRVGCASSS